LQEKKCYQNEKKKMMKQRLQSIKLKNKIKIKKREKNRDELT